MLTLIAMQKMCSPATRFSSMASVGRKMC